MKKQNVNRIIFSWFFIFITLALWHKPISAWGSFTLEDEKKLGKEFHEKLEQSNVLLKNERINEYVNKIGQKIVSQSKNVPFEFKFSVIKSAAINAFATPGGYVYITRGLINLVENESELAGVIAHEVAHVNARHIASIIDKSQKLGMATLAAILAGAFLGGGGDLTAAVTSFSLAAATTLNLRYSREHEEEADRLGLYYLTRAGYNGSAMLDFLRAMRRYEFYSNSVPSYFLTHPGTDERIRYLDAALQTTYKEKRADIQIGNLKRIQTLLMFGERNLEKSLNYFQNELSKNQNDVDALYGIAVTYERLGNTSASLECFQKALSLAPDDYDILKDLGIVYFKLGRTADAVMTLRKAVSIEEENFDALFYLGMSYEALGDYAKSLAMYEKAMKKNPEDDELYRGMAVAYGKTQNPGLSHYYFGIYFKKKNKNESALFHFKAALKYFEESDEIRQNIEKEISQLEPQKTKPTRKRQ